MFRPLALVIDLSVTRQVCPVAGLATVPGIPIICAFNCKGRPGVDGREEARVLHVMEGVHLIIHKAIEVDVEAPVDVVTMVYYPRLKCSGQAHHWVNRPVVPEGPTNNVVIFSTVM